MQWTKSTDDLYDHYYELPDGEKFQFLLEVLENNPEIDVDFLDMLYDTIDYEEHRIESLLKFANTYRRVNEERYFIDYQFIENHIADWAFYASNEEIIDRCLEVVKNDPVVGIDSITTRILFQLIFHGYYQKAVEYSESVLPKIKNRDTLFGNPEDFFTYTIYLDALDNQYEILTSGDSSQWTDFVKSIGELGVDIGGNTMGLVKQGLTTELSAQSVGAMLKTTPEDALVLLDVHFLRYMKSRYGLPFLHSEFLFNIINTPRIFGSIKEPEGYFYIDYNSLYKHIDVQWKVLLGANGPEMLGRIMGINYFYEFIHSVGLISDHYYELMLQNIAYVQRKMVRYSAEFVWTLSFVLDWPASSSQLLSFSKELFDREAITSTTSYRDVMGWIETHIAKPVGADRIESEIDSELRSRVAISPRNIVSNGLETFVKQDPETGRNDPCPCGSGKKYKKCCLKS